jgi:hypothetical protein
MLGMLLTSSELPRAWHYPRLRDPRFQVAPRPITPWQPAALRNDKKEIPRLAGSLPGRAWHAWSPCGTARPGRVSALAALVGGAAFGLAGSRLVFPDKSVPYHACHKVLHRCLSGAWTGLDGSLPNTLAASRIHSRCSAKANLQVVL